MGEQRNPMEVLFDLLDEAFAPRKQRCSFGKLIDEAPDKISSVLNALLVNPDVSTRKIHLLLKRSGAVIGRDTLADHRNKICTCYGAQNGASE